jgi:hypothetical protein
MKLSKLISRIVKYKWDIINCLIIAVFISIIGFLLHAWTGDLKGDDTYFHAGMVQYILDNFPHINWAHQFWNGSPPLQFDTPTYYLAIALEHIMTSLPITSLMQVTLFFSLVATGVAAYILAKTIGIQRILAIGLSLLFFTMSLTWNGVLIGGSWVRIAAFPFIFISLAVAYKHIREINKSEKSTKTYIVAVVIYSIAALVHPLIWQWTFVFLLGMYLVGLTGWRRKIVCVTKIFVPVAVLVAWMYVPLFKSYLPSTSSVAGGVAHDTTLMQWRWLIYIPSSHLWSTDIGPLVLPMALLSIMLAVIYWRRIAEKFSIIWLEWRIAVLFFALSVYFFLYGWVPMPQSTYLMASGDYAFWFGISLILLCIFIFAILARVEVFSNFHTAYSTAFQFAFLLVVLLAVEINMPFLKAFTDVDNPTNITSSAYDISQIVSLATKSGGVDSRLFNEQRVLTRWLYFSDPNVSISGGRTGYVPNKYYNQEANASISYRFTSKQDRARIYVEDRPQVWPSTIEGDENYYSPMFWLDWDGASGPILLPSYYPQEATAQGYASRPQFFQQFETNVNIGPTFFYKYLDSSPITVSTQASVIAMPFQQGDAPAFYNELLNSLSSLNLNSQWIIPVKLNNADGLNQFNTAIVEDTEYIPNEKSLDKYVANGGHLIVTGVYNNPQSLLNININDIGISFQLDASPLTAPSGSVILAQTQQSPIAYRTSLGKGTITVMGISLEDFSESNSVASTLLLIEAIAPTIKLNNVLGQMDSSSISYLTSGMIGGISLSSNQPNQNVTASNWVVSWNTEKAQGQINSNSGTENMTTEFNGIDTHNQVNFSAALSNTVLVESSGYVEFDIWTDSDPIVAGSFSSPNLQEYSSCSVQTEKGEWVHNILPLSAFNYSDGNFSISQEFTFAVNDNPTAGLTGNSAIVNLQVKNFNIVSPNQVEENGVSTLNFVSDPYIDHNQINWTFPFPQSVSVDSDATVQFSLWSDGANVSSIGVTLSQGNNGFLFYNLPNEVWTGWKDFELPLSYFQWKEGGLINNFNSLSLCFNEDSPYNSQANICEFKIQDLSVTSLINSAIHNDLNGTWLHSDKFTVNLGDNKEVLWKESYSTSWKIIDNTGQKVNYYFAGPGMIYLVAPNNAQSLTFIMPVPTDRIIGIVISIFSLVVIISFFVLKKRIFRRICLKK